MSLLDSLFGRKQAAQKALGPAFNFAFGIEGFEQVYVAAYTAAAENDEATMRAILEFLEKTIPHEEPDRMEASKPATAAAALGMWLMSQKRFAEAEAVIKRVRGWKQVGPSPFLESRLILAEAIWAQGSRERAEKEALIYVEMMLKETKSEVWPTSKSRAKFAQLRFDFLEQARWEEQSFEEGSGETPESLQTRRADPQLHLQTALAWSEAGRDTLALPHLKSAFECAQSMGSSEMVLAILNLQTHWLARTDQWQTIPAIGDQAVEWAGDNESLRRQAQQTQASIAWRYSRLDEAEQLLTALESSDNANDNHATMLLRCELAQERGDFAQARQIIEQQALLFPVQSQSGSLNLALNGISRAMLERRAFYCEEQAHLDTALTLLEQAAPLVRGYFKLGLWIEATSVSIRAAQGVRDPQIQREVEMLEAELNSWSDSSDTRGYLCESLLLASLWMGEPARAVLWGEELVEIHKLPLALASSRELLARACLQSGDDARARAEWTWVAERPFDCVSVRLAKRALENLV